MQDELEVPGMDTVGIACDGMTLTPSTLSHIRAMFPALKLMFPEETWDMQRKKIHYGVFKDVSIGILQNLLREQNV